MHEPSTVLPPVFAAQFDERMLMANPSTLIAIDPAGAILWVNPAWFRFAHLNGGIGERLSAPLGTNYFESIAGSLRQFYCEAFAQALETGRPFEQDYECSSPDVHREMRLRALPLGTAGLLLEHSQRCKQVTLHPRRAACPEDYLHQETRVVIQCSNCRKVRRVSTGEWDWVPEWVASPLEATSHGMCEVCFGFYWGHLVRR